MHILFCHTGLQNVLQKVIKVWTLKVYLLTGEPSSWLLQTESLKMTCTRSHAWFLDFLSNSEGLDCFLWPDVLPKVSKDKQLELIWLVQSQQIDYQFETAQSYENYQFEIA